MTVHKFRQSLAASHSHSDAPWWEEIYREAFPTFAGMVNVRDPGSGQRDGIDRHIALTNGRTITVDEKVRETDYPDFCLEYWSVKHKSNRSYDEPGWIAKDLRCDYIAYAFAPSGRCYLLPFPLLRRAWRYNHADWVARYFQVEADNGHYRTISVAVPIAVVLNAVTGACLVRFTPQSEAA